MTDILMPALSPEMEEGILSKWLVRVGDTISAGQVICEIETDKATMEVEAVDEGTIDAILVPSGISPTRVNTPIARLSNNNKNYSIPRHEIGAQSYSRKNSEYIHQTEKEDKNFKIDKNKNGNKIFIVHGHDEAALQSLARFLEKIGLEVIILKEQPNQGRTIIEKYEACAAEVGFAIVLLTPDDIGAASGSLEQSSRARQNVIFELGYFSAKLGRGRVCLLRKGSVEIPSDLFGIVYTEMDTPNGWKHDLVGELKAAKLNFDANKIWS